MPSVSCPCPPWWRVCYATERTRPLAAIDPDRPISARLGPLPATSQPPDGWLPALEHRADRCAAAVSARARRPGAARAISEPFARSSARSDAAGRHGRGGRSDHGRHRAARSGLPSTATTTWTASPRPSSCAARSNCSAPTCALHPRAPADGYGLQPSAIDRLHADGVALVVSVDCGIRGAEAARRARELGVDLIITDHHEPDTRAAAGAAP